MAGVPGEPGRKCVKMAMANEIVGELLRVEITEGTVVEHSKEVPE